MNSSLSESLSCKNFVDVLEDTFYAFSSDIFIFYFLQFYFLWNNLDLQISCFVSHNVYRSTVISLILTRKK